MNEKIICAELWRTSLDNRRSQRPEGECRMDECRIESKKRCKAAEGRSGVTVKEVGGSMEGFNPVDRWKAALEKKRAHNIINSAKGGLDFTVLLRSVWARHTKDGAL